MRKDNIHLNTYPKGYSAKKKVTLYVSSTEQKLKRSLVEKIFTFPVIQFPKSMPLVQQVFDPLSMLVINL